MKQDITKVIMNPIRQRIMQYLILHKMGTTNEIKSELSDIPPASLYRHIKVLLEAGCIEVAEEKKVRGTIEKTYRMNERMGAEYSEQDVQALIQTALLSIMTSFQSYFAKEGVDPMKDLLSLSTSTLLLSDEEYIELLQKIGNSLNEVIRNKPAENRKPRRFTIISSPCEE